MRKRFLGPEGEERPISFLEGFIYISKREESTYQFAKGNGLGKREKEVPSLIFNRENEDS